MTPSEMGKKGAAVTNAKLTPEQRSANGRKGAQKRWKLKSAAKRFVKDFGPTMKQLAAE